MKHLISSLVLALAGVSPAFAQSCNLTASTSGSGLQKLYDPFSAANTVADLRVTISNGSDQACVARLFVAPVNGLLALSDNGQLLTYRVEGPSNGSRPGEHGPFSISVPAGGSETLSISFTVLGQQVVPRGFYTSSLVVRGEDGANQPILIGGVNPVLTMAVPNRSEIGISGAASPPLSSVGMAPATINFPDAQMGQTGRVYVNVWANSSVVVRLSSENNGVLKHIEQPTLPPIDYRASFDGASINLGTAYSVGRTPPMTITGASYPLEITLGDTSRNFAGRYRDRITVDVTSN